MKDKFYEKTIETKDIFDGKIIKVQVDDVLLPDGKKAKREIVKHPGAVALIALTEGGKIIFVEQFRKPLEKTILEIPAGKLEPGEKPEITAARELEEETGYRAGKLEHLISFYTSPGFADELLHVYVATELEKVESPAAGDEDEFIELFELTLEEAEECVEHERIMDAKTAFAVAYLRSRQGLKKI